MGRHAAAEPHQGPCAARQAGRRLADWVGVASPSVAVLVVSYCTPGDVLALLGALDGLAPSPGIAVFVCENGGQQAWTDLCQVVERRFGDAEDVDSAPGTRFAHVARFKGARCEIAIGEPGENLGYAGGVNAWMLPLLQSAQWEAFWIVNPDAVPAPDCLMRLMDGARLRGLGLIGSRVMTDPPGDHVRSMGLRWGRLRAITQAVGFGAAIEGEVDPDTLDARIQAPTGASVLFSRGCAAALAPLDEQYFLYYEDLDWGVRAKSLGYRVGYAHDSVVVHAGGRSLGFASSGPGASTLALYLEHRNRLLFVSKFYPRWWAWTVALSWLRLVRLARHPGLAAASRGLLAGMRGEAGRPDQLLAQHRVPGNR